MDIRFENIPDSDRSAVLLDRVSLAAGEIISERYAARRVIERGLEHGILPITIDRDDYPITLRDIEDAPPIIYVRGNLQALKVVPGVAVVGTRKATPHGLTISERLSEFLSTNRVSVVSGLALGIDAAAHVGALKGAAPTIAVLAHGLEKASPKANSFLADRILEAGGAWLSEHALGVSARPEYFVLRNRIQVGLSCASVIVEGEIRSGSATQAEYCLRNRRLLFAVLPDPSARVNIASSLPQQLVLSRGAFAIRSRADYTGVLRAVEEKASEMRMIAGAGSRS